MSYPFIGRYFSGIFKTAFATDQIKATDILRITLSLEVPAEFSRNMANRALASNKGSLNQVIYQEKTRCENETALGKLTSILYPALRIWSSWVTTPLPRERGHGCKLSNRDFFTICRKSSEWHLSPESTRVQRTKCLGLNACGSVQQHDL